MTVINFVTVGLSTNTCKTMYFVISVNDVIKRMDLIPTNTGRHSRNQATVLAYGSMNYSSWIGTSFCNHSAGPEAYDFKPEKHSCVHEKGDVID